MTDEEKGGVLTGAWVTFVRKDAPEGVKRPVNKKERRDLNVEGL